MKMLAENKSARQNREREQMLQLTMEYTRKNTEEVRVEETKLLKEITEKFRPEIKGHYELALSEECAMSVNDDFELQRRSRRMLTWLEELGAGVAYGTMSLDVVNAIAGDQVIDTFRRWANFVYARQAGLVGLTNLEQGETPTPENKYAFDQFLWLACLLRKYRQFLGQETADFAEPRFSTDWSLKGDILLPSNRCYHPHVQSTWRGRRKAGTIAAIVAESKTQAEFLSKRKEYYRRFGRIASDY